MLGGGAVNQKQLMKWQFYTVASEEFIMYLHKDKTLAAFSEMHGLLTDHQLRSIPKDFEKKSTLYYLFD